MKCCIVSVGKKPINYRFANRLIAIPPDLTFIITNKRHAGRNSNNLNYEKKFLVLYNHKFVAWYEAWKVSFIFILLNLIHTHHQRNLSIFYFIWHIFKDKCISFWTYMFISLQMNLEFIFLNLNYCNFHKLFSLKNLSQFNFFKYFKLIVILI